MNRIVAALIVTLSLASTASADTLRVITMQGQNVTVHGVWDAR